MKQTQLRLRGKKLPTAKKNVYKTCGEAAADMDGFYRTFHKSGIKEPSVW